MQITLNGVTGNRPAQVITFKNPLQATNTYFPQVDGDKFASSNKPLVKVRQFGTSGYRAIGEEFESAVPQLTTAVSDYLIREMKKTGEVLPILVGGDTRPVTHKHKMTVALQLLAKGFDVYVDEAQLPTPVLAYAAKHFNQLGKSSKKAAGSILLTASHNPWPYGGFNFLTNDGEVAPTPITKELEKLQANPLNLKLDRTGKMDQMLPSLFDAYLGHIDKLIDFDKIREAKIGINFDPMYGAATRFFPDMMAERQIPISTINESPKRPKTIHANGPDPTAANLGDLAKLVRDDKKSNSLRVGLANDGDADRFGVLDETGKFIQPNDVLLLTLHHLANNKNRSGIVVRSQATSHILDEVAKRYGMEVVETPVGYKYIAEIFKEHPVESPRPVVLGGESSGGLSIYGHIPEKDGLIANLSMLELMAYEKKPLGQILKDIKAGLPKKFSFTELAITTDKKDDLSDYFAKMAKEGGKINGVDVDVELTQKNAAKLSEKFHTTDGTKLYLKDGSWLLSRKSGTEPMARIYYELTADSDKALAEKRDSMMKYVNNLLTSEPFKIDAKSIKVKLDE